MPQLKKFQTMTQSFKQFPEYKWNKADNILMEATDDIDMMIKAKRLRFTIIPDIFTEKSQLDIFVLKIDKLSAFFTKYCKGVNESVAIKIDESAFQKLFEDGFTQSDDSITLNGEQKKEKPKTFKASKYATNAVNSFEAVPGSVHINTTLWLKGPRASNPKWAYLSHDEYIRPNRVFHLDLQWLACDSWLLEEFITLLFRRCTGWGIRIVQVLLGTICESNLSLFSSSLSSLSDLRVLLHSEPPTSSVPRTAIHRNC